MNKCEYCKYRFSWDCDDGLPYPNNGCENFALDQSVLSGKTIDQEFLHVLLDLELDKRKRK